MRYPVRKILEDQRDLLLFRPFRPDIRGHRDAYLAWGLLTTWLAGVGRGGDQARPSVSNMEEASASRLSLPAQTTNWKAWK
jgi:hypothetical protein